MVGAEWPAIFPLRIGGLVPLADRDPAVFADRAAGLRVSLLKPRNDQGGLGLELTVRHVVVRERAIKWVLPRNERGRDVVLPRTGIRRVEAAVVRGPIGVPRTFHVRDRIVAASSFTDPENGRDDVRFPGEPRHARLGGRRDKDLGLDLEKGLLTELHGVLGEVG